MTVDSKRRGAPGRDSTRRRLRAAAQVVAAALIVVLAAAATHTTDVLIVVVALIIMIMVHELGHFATAKWSHMKVTEYFLGFGPRLWSVRRGETEYGVKAIPAGGYVKIVGMSNLEEVDPADEPRTYRQQPFHNRLLVAVAGSAMHAVMAILLIWGYFAFAGIPSADVVSIQALAPLTGGADPARAAGLRAGDIVERFDGHRVTSVEALSKDISGHAGTPVTVVVSRGGTLHTIVVTPLAIAVSASAAGSSPPTGHIGVEIAATNVHVGPLSSIGHSGVAFGATVSASVSALGQIFSPHGISQYLHDLTNAKAATASEHSTVRIQSIYGAVRTAAQGAQAGWGGLIAVLVSINVFVGMLNLLPMLPLDGGHVAIAVYERIRSRRGRAYHADVAKLAPVAYAFVLFLGFIVVSSLYLDITHPVANPFH
ncbi:MAG TPA: site-2 protease family protein [Acidimicrobiales bacterium]|nr:site-2 protease family protein [Acidimicrobiales bacterium]